MKCECCLLQVGRIISACFSSDMNILSVFAEDDSDSHAGVRLLMVRIVTRAVPNGVLDKAGSKSVFECT